MLSTVFIFKKLSSDSNILEKCLSVKSLILPTDSLTVFLIIVVQTVYHARHGV